MRTKGAALVVAVTLLAACASNGSDAARRPISTPAPVESTTASAPTTAPITTTTTAATTTGSGPATGSAGSTSGDAGATRDREVTFDSGGLTIHGSLRVPVHADGTTVPAVVLLAGSGPTDRDGNSTQLAGRIDTLAWLADQFGRQGVASLRYDKLGTGATGMGTAATRPSDIGFDVFVQEARDAVAFLADQPGIDSSRLIIGGHSEGGLIAMVVADDPGAGAPLARGVALFAPPAARYLDLVTAQVEGQTAAAVASGKMTDAAAAAFDDHVEAAVAAVRAGRALPADLPKELTSIFNATTTHFLEQADQVDPAAIAAGLGAPRRVLLVCAEKDVQVPCAGARHLQEQFPAGTSTFVSLRDTDHVLKDIGARTSDGTEYTADLPFSAELEAPLHDFVRSLG